MHIRMYNYNVGTMFRFYFCEVHPIQAYFGQLFGSIFALHVKFWPYALFIINKTHSYTYRYGYPKKKKKKKE